MKTLLAGAFALTPVAALAHAMPGHAGHVHPHGAEYAIAALVVTGAVVLAIARKR